MSCFFHSQMLSSFHLCTLKLVLHHILLSLMSHISIDLYHSCPVLNPAFIIIIIEASAKTRDGVQCAFEELVEKILQTPGLWESSIQNHGVQLSDNEPQRQGACGGYCSLV